jgi:hypothetical protein
MKRSYFLFPIVVLLFSMVHPKSSYGDDFYSPYSGGSKNYRVIVTVAPRNHYFEINGIAPFRTTTWYVNGTMRETDKSGVLGIDPAITVYMPGGAHEVVASVTYGAGDGWGVILEGIHRWNVQSGVLTPDLQVTSMEINDSTAANQQFLPGQLARLDFLGANQGSTPVFHDISMKWWYGTSPYAKTHGIYSDHLEVSGEFRPGQSNWVTDAVWPMPTTPGAYWLTVRIDDNNRVGETVETNNESTLQFIVLPGLTDALDDPDLNWTDGGNRPWLYQTSVTHDGRDAAQSGRIGHGQSSSLQTLVIGPGTLSFWWKVSSEPRDRLSLYLNDSLHTQISGIKSWRRVELPLPDGIQVLRWTYRKNRGLKGGQDRAWLDQVSFIPAPIPAAQLAGHEFTSAQSGEAATTPVRLNISVANGQVALAWPAARAENYRVLYTDSLLDPQWEVLDVEPVIHDGLAAVGDPARNRSQRFYRVIQDSLNRVQR